jgi:hypothetical protein
VLEITGNVTANGAHDDLNAPFEITVRPRNENHRKDTRACRTTGSINPASGTVTV